MTRRQGPEAQDLSAGIPGSCRQHPDIPATYVCDGCAARLCVDCIDEGHRLTMCKLCGELAVPLGREFGGEDRLRRGVASDQLSRPASSAKISLGHVLLYPLRGTGGWLLGAYLVLSVVLELLGSGMLLGLVLIPIFFALPLMVGSLFLAIIRKTAEGYDEMPDWPEWDLQDRLEDVLKLGSVLVVAVIPVALALLLAGCFGDETPTRCWVAGLVGAAAGAVFAVIALGAAAIYDDLMAAIRLDLHARALAVIGKDAALLVAFLMALYIAGGAALLAVSEVPLVGHYLGFAVSTYTLFLAAHLVGLLFRLHESEVVAVYMT